MLIVPIALIWFHLATICILPTESNGHPELKYRWRQGIMPYQFDPNKKFTRRKKRIIEQSIDQFNKEMDGCLEIV